MFTTHATVIRASTLPDIDLPETALDPAQIVGGAPQVRTLGLVSGPGLAIGIWQHSTGISRDIEADEVFIVLTGRATIEVEGGPSLEVGPGDLGMLPAGARTVWTVHETLRKVYLVGTAGPAAEVSAIRPS